MRVIGGELESKAVSENIFFTDSGRSSLRLFLRNGYKDKKILIPNFFCEVIEDVLRDESINYDFYTISDNLQIDMKSVNSKQFDIFYIINYFGQLLDISDLSLDDKIVLEDNVFFADFENRNNLKQWYGFNSYRKISSLSDGSLIKTNLSINSGLIQNKVAPFVNLKNEAKEDKYNYLESKIGDETLYLEKFEKAENLINEQKNIYRISPNSQYKILVNDTANDQLILEQRFLKLKKVFLEYCLNKSSLYFSHFILKLENRDKLRTNLMKKNIFLPIHWSKSSQKNELYDKIISIPLFSNYKDKEFNYLLASLQELIL